MQDFVYTDVSHFIVQLRAIESSPDTLLACLIHSEQLPSISTKSIHTEQRALEDLWRQSRVHAMETAPAIRGGSGWLLTEATPNARIEALERPPGTAPTTRYCGQSLVEFLQRQWDGLWLSLHRDTQHLPSPHFASAELRTPDIVFPGTPVLLETASSRAAAARGDMILGDMRRASLHKLLSIPIKKSVVKAPPPKTVISYP